MITKIDTNQIVEQNHLASHSLAELGCSTDGCDDAVTHLSLVEIKLVSGQKLNITKVYCAICIMAVQGTAKA